jgi:PAS domain S-box-containing protein
MGEAAPEAVTVLHVDDEPGFTELVANFLEREDPAFSVRCETTVDDALSAVDGADVDCVVSDYDMPGKDGLDFLELVRDEHPDLPFILFTGKGSEEIASKAISAGVTDYLQKEGGTDQYTILANRILNAVRAVEAEAAAERTEERYHNLVDTAPIPILLFDERGETVYANEAAVTFLDADSCAELYGTPFTEFLHPEDRQPATERFGNLMREETSMPEREYRVRTVDGEIKRATVATAPGYYRGERVAQAMVYR